MKDTSIFKSYILTISFLTLTEIIFLLQTDIRWMYLSIRIFFHGCPHLGGPHSHCLSIFMTLREALFEEPLQEFITCTIFLC